jgi:hypothetical protein
MPDRHSKNSCQVGAHHLVEGVINEKSKGWLGGPHPRLWSPQICEKVDWMAMPRRCMLRLRCRKAAIYQKLTNN